MGLKTVFLVLPLLICAPESFTRQAKEVAPVAAPDAACPVTTPGGKYGNAFLQTVLWSDGTIIFEPPGPGMVLRDGSLKIKFPWIRHVSGKLSIHGRRLDASAPDLRAIVQDGYRESGFQPSYLIFPTVGCWEVTGSVAGHDLTFVTRVVKTEAAPVP